jgi:hypothetical protein
MHGHSIAVPFGLNFEIYGRAYRILSAVGDI